MLKFLNTMSGELETFAPLEGDEVRLYACGPTVYNFAHIGNFRTFVFVDVLRRYLKYRGYAVRHVMNLTDIDDKIIRDAKKAGEDLNTFTQRYVTYFLEDAETLGIETPEIVVRATDHIHEMIHLVARLLGRGVAYESEGSVYFQVEAFEEYGKLSGAKLAGNVAGASERVDADEYEKGDARDFVLWKGARDDEPSWDAEFGNGRPGWHLECSAMAMKYLGESFDIHCGGVDLIFPHHENEIAQSEAATGKPFVKYWLHAEHLMVEGRKMSKREGNYYTLRDLVEKGHSPRAIRYVLASVPYRKPLNFTIDGVHGAERRIKRLNEFARRLREAPVAAADDARLRQEIDAAQSAFEAGMDDDLNTAQALAAVTMLETAINVAVQENRLTATAKGKGIAVLERMDGVFGFLDPSAPDDLLDAEIQALIDERLAARKAKNFARGDEIRATLAERGIVLEDGRDGVTRWRRG
jgi:cysteinyl-tRNA synthetase